MPKKKCVYIIGAGFSYPAKIPIQSKLLNEVFKYPTSYTDARFSTARERVRLFMATLFDSTDQVTLEDLFTILDRSVIAKERFQNHKWSELYDFREDLIYSILHVIERKLTKIPPKILETYHTIAKFLIEKRRAAGLKHDELAVISSNWDTLLENCLHEQIASSALNDTEVDYCIYTHFIKDKGIPHTNLKALRQYNIKVLKLHGSLNWLFCSNCGRIYVGRENIGIQKEECRYCNQISTGTILYLEPLIITPTLLKEYNNLHIKNIWQNAFIDVQEASEVIFIGYSLPLADYEFKYLLKKAIGPDTKITAVLTRADEKNGTKKRYTNFLGNNVSFYFEGLQEWVKKKMKL